MPGCLTKSFRVGADLFHHFFAKINPENPINAQPAGNGYMVEYCMVYSLSKFDGRMPFIGAWEEAIGTNMVT